MKSQHKVYIKKLYMSLWLKNFAIMSLFFVQTIVSVSAETAVYPEFGSHSGSFYGIGNPGQHTFNRDVFLKQPEIFSEQDILGQPEFDLDEVYGSGQGKYGLLKSRNFSFAAASVDGASSAGGDEGPSLEEISRMMNNPLAYLWMMFVENNTMLYRGGDSPVQGTKVINSTIVQPVMPIPITDDINLINRPIIPLTSAELPAVRNRFGAYPSEFNTPPETGTFPRSIITTDRSFNLGDMSFFSAVAPKEPWQFGEGKFTAGVGPTFTFPTATDDRVGSGKWSAGPMGIAAYLGEKWTFATILQQWWSFAGDSDRPDVSKGSFQYIAWYNLGNQMQIGMMPIITVDWNAKDGNRLTLPIGLGVSKTVKLFDKMPLRIIFEVDYAVVAPDDFHNTWNFRLALIPVLPNPFAN